MPDHPPMSPLTDAAMIVAGWNALLGAVRTETSLTVDVLEIAICRVMLVAGAWHEWNNHVPKLLGADGFTEQKLETVKKPLLQEQGPLDDRQWAALLYAEHMSRAVTVPDCVFKKLGDAGFDAKEIVELTTVVATYNMVGRFFVALDVAESNAKTAEYL